MRSRRPIRAHLQRKPRLRPARARARHGSVRPREPPKVRSALLRGAVGTPRRLPTHARWLPRAPPAWKATPPRVLARISSARLRRLPHIAAGPGSSEGLTYLGLLAWRPAREIPPLQAPLPFSVPVAGRLCPPFSRSVPAARLREGILPGEGEPSRPTTEFPVLPDSRASSRKPPLTGDGASSLPSFRHR